MQLTKTVCGHDAGAQRDLLSGHILIELSGALIVVVLSVWLLLLLLVLQSVASIPVVQ